MFQDPVEITTDIGTEPLVQTFVRIQSGLNGSVYRAEHDETVPIGVYPSYLKIAQTVVGKGVGRRNRAVVRFETLSEDASSGVSVFGTRPSSIFYAVSDLPQSYLAENMTQWDLLSYLIRTYVGMMRNVTAGSADTRDYATYAKKIANGEV